jgi:hypothetical protein
MQVTVDGIIFGIWEYFQDTNFILFERGVVVVLAPSQRTSMSIEEQI